MYVYTNIICVKLFTHTHTQTHAYIFKYLYALGDGEERENKIYFTFVRYVLALFFPLKVKKSKKLINKGCNVNVIDHFFVSILNLGTNRKIFIG